MTNRTKFSTKISENMVKNKLIYTDNIMKSIRKEKVSNFQIKFK